MHTEWMEALPCWCDLLVADMVERWKQLSSFTYRVRNLLPRGFDYGSCEIIKYTFLYIEISLSWITRYQFCRLYINSYYISLVVFSQFCFASSCKPSTKSLSILLEDRSNRHVFRVYTGFHHSDWQIRTKDGESQDGRMASNQKLFHEWTSIQRLQRVCVHPGNQGSSARIYACCPYTYQMIGDVC